MPAWRTLGLLAGYGLFGLAALSTLLTVAAVALLLLRPGVRWLVATLVGVSGTFLSGLVGWLLLRRVRHPRHGFDVAVG